jgi:choline-sulfatase
MKQPHIILIVSDQHRGDFMGHAGNSAVRTPNLDFMAAGGVSFAQHYCNSPLCVPSRMSMMTGRHPCHTGVFGNEDCLPSDMPTFAHALALGGYQTVLCGRMHFVGPDQRHGYHQRLVGDITPSYSGGPKTNYGILAGTPDSDMVSIRLAGQGPNPVMRYDEAVTSACEQYCGQYVAERNKAANKNKDRNTDGKTDGNTHGNTYANTEQKPLFLTVGLYGPHNPYTCSEEEYEQALAAMEKYNKPIPSDRELHPWLKETIKSSGLEAITAEQLIKARANYIGLVNQLDQLVGRIIKAAQSLQEETILIYLSDHGDMAGDHGLFWKRAFYEGAARVPMIWYPINQHEASPPTADLAGIAKIAKGRAIEVPTSLVDLAPTLVSLSQSPAMPRYDGNDLTPLLQHVQLSDKELGPWRDRPVFSELVLPNRAPARMVRFKEFKLVYYHGYALQLFNLDEDPEETTDLSGLQSCNTMKQLLLDRLLDGWDAEALISQRDAKKPDLAFMKQWGQNVGMGKLDLWNYEA